MCLAILWGWYLKGWDMLLSFKLTAFTASILFRGNQQGEGGKFSPSPTQKRDNPSEKSIRKMNRKRAPSTESFGATLFIKCKSEDLEYYSDVFF